MADVWARLTSYLLTFPALVFTGMPPVMSNATSTVAVFPGYLGGALGFRNELGGFDRRRLLRLAVITLAGGLVGSGLLLVWSNETFSVVVVVQFLLLGATLAFLFGDRVRQWTASKARDVSSEGALGLFAVALYGGYFNGGLGIDTQCSPITATSCARNVWAMRWA